METQTRSTQTAFRFRPELVRRLKNRARLEKKSLNAFVEETLERALGPDEDAMNRIIEELGKCRMPEEPLRNLIQYNLEDNDVSYETLKEEYFREKYGL